MMNNNQDETQEEKTVVFAGYEEDTGTSGELPLNHDPWAAAVGGLPGPSASASSNQPGQAFTASRRRFTGNKILMFAAVVLAVLLALGAGIYALMSVEAQHAPRASQVPTTAPNQQARPAPAPMATQAPTPTPTANPQPAAPNNQQQQNNAPPPAALTLQDNFARTVQPGSWGKVNGHKWQIIGDKQAFSVNNNSGQISPVPTNQQQLTGFYSALIGPATSNTVDANCTFSMVYNGQNNMGVVLRWQDANNYYKAYVNGSQLVVMKNVGGQQTGLASTNFVAQSGTSYTVRFRSTADGSLLAKAWEADQQEPAQWTLQANDTDITSGKAGVRALLLVGDFVQVSAFQVSA